MTGAGEHNPQAKILFWDIECAMMLLSGRAYDLRFDRKRLPSDWITRARWLPCAAWKFLGSNIVGSVSVLNDRKRFEACHWDDYHVVKILHEVLSEADILVGHNGDAYDLKMFNARAIMHGLDPLPPKQTIDTLKVARRVFRFESNELRYLARHLGIGEKDQSPDWGLVSDGDAEEIALCGSYNRQDVRVLEAVYLKLRSFDKSHPNLNVYQSGVEHLTCSKCGSHNLQHRGFRHTKAGKYKSYWCKDCRSSSQDKKNLLKTDNLR